MEKGKYIENYTICLYNSIGNAEISRLWSVKAVLNGDVSDVMPYLNADLDYAIYSGDKRFIIWNEGDRRFSLRPTELVIDNILNLERATYFVSGTIAKLNDIWDRRAEINPSYEKKSLPTPHEVWKVLSRKNCGSCGFANCMVFAAELLEGKAQLEHCKYLFPGRNEISLEAV